VRSVHIYSYENSGTKCRSGLEVAPCAGIYSNEKLKSVLKLTVLMQERLLRGRYHKRILAVSRVKYVRNYFSFCRVFSLLTFMHWNGRLHWKVEALQIEYYSALLHGIFYSPLEGGSQYRNWGAGSMTEGRVSIPSEAEHFSLPQRVYTSSGRFKPTTKRVPWALSKG